MRFGVFLNFGKRKKKKDVERRKYSIIDWVTTVTLIKVVEILLSLSLYSSIQAGVGRFVVVVVFLTRLPKQSYRRVEVFWKYFYSLSMKQKKII